MSSPDISFETYLKMIQLQESASFEYLTGLVVRDRDQALKAGKELIVLSCLEQLSGGDNWLEIVRDELVSATFDLDTPLLALESLRLYSASAKDLQYLPGISSASVKPGGSYDVDEIIEGFYEGSLTTTP